MSQKYDVFDPDEGVCRNAVVIIGEQIKKIITIWHSQHKNFVKSRVMAQTFFGSYLCMDHVF